MHYTRLPLEIVLPATAGHFESIKDVRDVNYVSYLIDSGIKPAATLDASLIAEGY